MGIIVPTYLGTIDQAVKLNVSRLYRLKEVGYPLVITILFKVTHYKSPHILQLKET